MKTLHLIRHAKSSWKDASLPDWERPLNKRGHKACSFMGAAIRGLGGNFSVCYCSPALRAQRTIRLLLEAENLPARWQTDPDLYTFSGDEVRRWVQALPPHQHEVMLIGHNPDLTDFVNDIAAANIPNIPTCGYVQLQSRDLTSWQDLAVGSMTLQAFITP